MYDLHQAIKTKQLSVVNKRHFDFGNPFIPFNALNQAHTFELSNVK